MPWDRNRPGTDPKYRTRRHREYRASLVAALKRDGYLTCTARVCVMPTRTITNPNIRARALAQLASAATAAGDPTHAHTLLTDPPALPRTITDPDTHAKALVEVATAAAAAGDLTPPEAIATPITNPPNRPHAQRTDATPPNTP